MIGIFAAFGLDHQAAQKWAAFGAAMGAESQRRVTVDNGGSALADVAGSNRHYEFSAYLEGLAEARKICPELSRVVIFNDTLFGHHWPRGWQSLVKADRSPGIWGDGRQDTLPDGRVLTFLASWHFDLVGRVAVDAFEEALTEVLADSGERAPDEVFEAYVSRYLQSGRWHGYSDPASLSDPKAWERKAQCIRIEHRLSQHKAVAPLMQSYGGARYRAIRIVDRWLSASRRASSLRALRR